MRDAMKLLACACVGAMGLGLSGCYTRLTTPKEAREFRITYPELETNTVVNLGNAHAHMGDSFIMTVETYVDALQRFRRVEEAVSSTGNDPYRFRPGSIVEIKLPGHPDDPINGQNYVVRPEGTIDVGPVRNFVVAGKTANEVGDELSRALSKWYRAFPEDAEFPTVNVNLPVFPLSPSETRTNWGEVHILGLASTIGSLAAGGSFPLTGDDSILTTLARSRSYTRDVDWREIAVRRKIKTDRTDPAGRQIEYYLIVLVDIEKVIYEDPNLNMDVQDGDIIILHPEKNPLIVEALRTAQVIVGAYSDFSGVEAVLQDIFKRDF